MPLYTVLTKRNLSASKKKSISDGIVKVHSKVTGAPPVFGTVLFMSGYRLKKNQEAMILGSIRIGGNRSQQIIDELKNKLIHVVIHFGQFNTAQVGLDFIGIKASWVYEGGMVLPDPGDEDTWLANNPNHH